MDYVRILESPHLREPVMIAAFAGWNDASNVATFAARFLVQQWQARKMAEVDPEEFYVFTETRPQVYIAGRFERKIEWPANEFFYHIDEAGKRDYVILVGIEPQLKWRTFSETIISLAKMHNISTLVSLGGLIADVPHTLPARLSGTSNSQRLAQRLRQLGVEPTRYQGPTGIVGVLGSAFAHAGIPSGSIWGSVPDYLSASPNVKVSLAILERLKSLFDLSLDLTEIRAMERQFDAQVSAALAENPEVKAYVEDLEQRERGLGFEETDEDSDEEPPAEQDRLPSGDVIVQELEDFLRRRQRPDEPEE